MPAGSLRSSSERPLFIVGVAFSSLVWLALVVSVVGIMNALGAMLFLAMARALLLARVRGDGVRISTAQMPELYELYCEAVMRAGLRTPPSIYVVQEGAALWAKALRLLGDDVIVVSSELVERCNTPGRFLFVVGHELGHVAEGHLAWRLFLAPFRIVPWLGPAYARACELTCDRYGMAAARDVTEAKRAILLQSCGHVHDAVDPNEYADQRRETEDFWSGVYEVVSEHPYATQRVARLDTATAEPPRARHPVATLLGPIAGIGAGTPASIALIVGLYLGASLTLAGPLASWTRAFTPGAEQRHREGASQQAPPAQTPRRPSFRPPPPRGSYTVEAGALQSFDGGISRQEYYLVRETGHSKVWVYRPPGRGYPVVLIPPAGGRSFVSAGLGDGDVPEHLPWARAGFMVVSHEIDGNAPGDSATDADWLTAAAAFRAVDGGIVNMREALDTALAQSPDADPTRVAVAGHSSAGAQALVFAAQDRRVRLCAAFMPPPDWSNGTPPRLRRVFRAAVPDIDDFVRMESPITHVASISVPVFLATAADDNTVSPEAVDGLHRALVEASVTVEYLRVAEGGHYDAMIREAQPAAIAWASRAFHVRPSHR